VLTCGELTEALVNGDLELVAHQPLAVTVETGAFRKREDVRDGVPQRVLPPMLK
jgi:hypothetical protein